MSRPDPSAAAARTDLAWQRSGLAYVALGVVVARGLRQPVTVNAQPLAGALILAIGLWFSYLSYRSARRRAAAAGLDRRPATVADLAPLAIGTSLGALAALVVALLA